MKKIIVAIIIAIITLTAFASAHNAIIENSVVSVDLADNGLEISIDTPDGDRYVHYDDGEVLRRYIENSVVSVRRADDGSIEVVINTPDGNCFVHYDDGSDL